MAAHCQTPKVDPPARAIAGPNHDIERNPGDAEAYFERAEVYAEAGDYHRARRDYTRAIELDADHILSLIHI